MEGDGRSRIPSLLRRSASVRVRGERHSVGGTCCSHPSADGDSVGSTASLVSCGSATSRPTGQTGVAASASSSGGPPRHRCRSVLHCQRPVETETYLTPTQRKDRELRQLRTALARANSEARVRDDRLRELAAQLQQLQIAQGITPSTNGMAASDGHAAGGASSSSLGDSGISGDLLPSRVDSVLPEEPELPPGGNSPPPQLATDHTGLPDDRDLAECSESEDSTDSFPDEGGRRRSSSGADGSLRRKYRQLKHRYEQRTESLLQMLGDINANFSS